MGKGLRVLLICLVCAGIVTAALYFLRVGPFSPDDGAPPREIIPLNLSLDLTAPAAPAEPPAPAEDLPPADPDPAGTPLPAEEPPLAEEPAPAEESAPAEEPAPAEEAPALSPAAQWAQETAAAMTLREKVYQLFIVTPEGLTGVPTATQAGATTRAALAEKPVGGVVYFAKNLRLRAQVEDMLRNTASYSKIPPFLAVDEEGGTVARVGSNPALGTTAFSSMADYSDPAEVREIGRTLGRELKALGFNLDFAPVADVVTNPANTEIGRRSFSSDPAEAAALVAELVGGMEDEGMLSTLKHFPGHGGTDTDTHYGLSVTERTLDEMREAELLPFRAGIEAGAPLVMVGHLSAPAVTGDYTPADLSPALVTGVLREELGFDGLIVTDAQNMGAVTHSYTAAGAAVAALEAGVDLILMPADLEQAADGVLAAVETGRLTEDRLTESVLRILTTKYEYGLVSQ